MKKILIVEDNRKIREELASFLSKNGYTCEMVEQFDDVIGMILASGAHLVLLDINLPEQDGYYICRQVRRQSDIPIIVVTSRDSDIDELTAMNLGADDFLTKPYNTQILLSRIASVLRRVYKETSSDVLDGGDFSVSLSKGNLLYKGEVTELTKNELRILSCLLERRGEIISRDELMLRLWNSDLFVDDNTLTVNMNRLRKKMEDAGLTELIETRRGQGYRMV